MAIARRPKTHVNVDVDALINLGGSVAQTAEHSSEGKQVVLRIPGKLFVQIERILQKRIVRIPRHTWILEALSEKIKKESV